MPALSASALPPFSLSSTHRLRWRRETYAPRSGFAGIRERSASRTGTRSNASCRRSSVRVGRAVVDDDHLVARVAQVEQRLRRRDDACLLVERGQEHRDRRRERRREDLVERRVDAGAPVGRQPPPGDQREHQVHDGLDREVDERDPRRRPRGSSRSTLTAPPGPRPRAGARRRPGSAAAARSVPRIDRGDRLGSRARGAEPVGASDREQLRERGTRVDRAERRGGLGAHEVRAIVERGPQRGLGGLGVPMRPSARAAAARTSADGSRSASIAHGRRRRSRRRARAR